MENKGIGQAGSLESNDLMVTVNLMVREDLDIELEVSSKRNSESRYLRWSMRPWRK